MQISRAAFDLIVAEEVTSEAVYKQKYRRPEWPGASSGVTVGIGYDLGQTAAATVRGDWSGRVPQAMLDNMVSACGVTGTRARALTDKLYDKINIPWETALAVHEQRVLPRWEEKTRKALPNFDMLSPDCKGALVSLTFNRGPSFGMAGARYKEMRAIKSHMASEDFDAIPAEFRSMKRLWPKLAGLRKRRDTEARLFERGLKAAMPVGLMSAPTDDEPSEVPAAVQSSPPAPEPVVVDKDVQGDPEIFSVQKRLKVMNYYSGVVDGRWGGKTAEAIGGFVNDRMFHLGVPTSLEMFNEVREYLKDELSRAEADGFKRPVSDARADAAPALVAEVAPEIVPAKRGFLAQAWASFLAFMAAIASTVSDKLTAAWAFFTENKDSLPTDSGLLSKAGEWISSVPVTVWILLAAAALGLLALNARSGVKGIEAAVKTGAR
jgi:peptidoglycan hydrolase-like protein with peptidoglycan-binding domain